MIGTTRPPNLDEACLETIAAKTEAVRLDSSENKAGTAKAARVEAEMERNKEAEVESPLATKQIARLERLEQQLCALEPDDLKAVFSRVCQNVGLTSAATIKEFKAAHAKK
jgi:hypothetical protein